MAKTSRPDRKRNDRRDSRREPSEFEDTTLSIDRVTRVVKGGRRMRFRAVVVIGNRKGKVGLGTGKASEVQASVQKAVRAAKRNMVLVPMKGETIPHEVNIKHKAAKLRLMPASKGTGIIAGGPLRVMLDLAGVQNAIAKSFGTGNKLVNAQAALISLRALRGSKPTGPAEQKPAMTSPLQGHPEQNLPIKTVAVTDKDKKEMGKGSRG